MKKTIVFILVILLCAIGVFAKQVPDSFTIAVWDKGPASDVILSTKIIRAFGDKDYDVPVGIAKLFSEVDATKDDQLLLVIYYGEAVSVTGDDASSSLVEFGDVVSSILDKLGVKQRNPVLTSELPSDDLLDLFGSSDDDDEEDEEETEEDDVDDEPEETEEEETIVEPPVKEEPACRDGCLLNKKCYPLAYRVSGNYCSASGKFKTQASSGSACENNFECKSNLCVDGACVEKGIFNKILKWFTNLFGG
ncbi:hypothetical protein KY360_01545 [Candidatus Woesearchaeota archaeon]|nr:hypothetical protein [Candidatus Woesearchaeota archaeon]